jgi:hypothetical protein
MANKTKGGVDCGLQQKKKGWDDGILLRVMHANRQSAQTLVEEIKI